MPASLQCLSWNVSSAHHSSFNNEENTAMSMFYLLLEFSIRFNVDMETNLLQGVDRCNDSSPVKILHRCLEYEFCWIYLRPALYCPKLEFSLGQVQQVRVQLSTFSILFGTMALPPKLPAGIGLLASVLRVVLVWWTDGRWHEVPWHFIATRSINSAHTNINLIWMIASVIKEFQFIEI